MSLLVMMRRDVATALLKKPIMKEKQFLRNQYPAIFIPIRMEITGPYKAVNYHRWDVCKAAVLLGKRKTSRFIGS